MGYRYQLNLTTLKTTHTDDKIKMPTFSDIIYHEHKPKINAVDLFSVYKSIVRLYNTYINFFGGSI